MHSHHRSLSVRTRQSPREHAQTSVVVHILRAAWIIILVRGEIVLFLTATRNCSWPDAPFLNTDFFAKPFHILLLADPQILDMRSYPGRPYILKKLGIWFTDNFFRKSWQFVLRHSKPDAVFFLGNLMDSGIQVVKHTKERSHYILRFKNLFRPVPASLPLHHLAGNHDLGLHNDNQGSSYARVAFQSTFNPLNGQITYGNHSITWIDAPQLLEESELPIDQQETAETSAFVRAITPGKPALPKILLSHIPLWRDEGTSCGALRESARPIRQGRGVNYQNELSKAPSDLLLKQIQPRLIFSGDDHDYCSVRHKSFNETQGLVEEISIKSFSMAMGIRQPGYQLLSLYNPSGGDIGFETQTAATAACFLPDQIGIYLNFYIPCIIFSILILCVRQLFPKSRPRQTLARSNGLPIHIRSPSSKLQRHIRRLSGKRTFASDSDSNPSDDELLGYGMDRVGYAYGMGIGEDEEKPGDWYAAKIMRRVSRVVNIRRRQSSLIGGPAFARPVNRALKKITRTPPMRVFSKLLGLVKRSPILSSILLDIWKVAWVTLLFFGLVWTFFAYL